MALTLVETLVKNGSSYIHTAINNDLFMSGNIHTLIVTYATWYIIFRIMPISVYYPHICALFPP